MKMNTKLACILLVNDRLDNFINKIVIDTAGVADVVLRMHSDEEALLYLAGDGKTYSTLPGAELIILDMEMKGFDVGGFLDTYTKIKMKLRVKPVIILLTSHSDLPAILRTFHSTELSGIYQRPFNKVVLDSIISEYFSHLFPVTFKVAL